jgi:hypothetical protein
MKANVGSLDRVICVIFGIVLIGASLTGVIGAWGWIGLVPIATGSLAFAPYIL